MSDARGSYVGGGPGTGALIDSDIFIDHLRGARRLVPPDGRACYSTITRCELFAGRYVDEDLVRVLLAPFAELPMDRAVAERAGRIRRATGVRTPDAIVAATALEHGLEVWTRNVRDFVRVGELRVRSP
ncbi:MAG: type II toxin-antitoxin system VapC family toxin [Planctomycetes bacterium]|nr:type II toxin-antitoxin system VapC family toxin [Planctomycetota bacterium]